MKREVKEEAWELPSLEEEEGRRRDTLLQGRTDQFRTDTTAHHSTQASALLGNRRDKKARIGLAHSPLREKVEDEMWIVVVSEVHEKKRK